MGARNTSRRWLSYLAMIAAGGLVPGWAAAAEPAPAAIPANAAATAAPALTADTLWVVGPDEPEPLRRALRDVENDWYKVFGRLPSVVDKLPEKWSAPILCLGLKAPWLQAWSGEKFAGPESFSLVFMPDKCGGPALLATGADVRGAIYAAYAVSEELLGVDPWYYWVDKEPAPRRQIPIPAGYAKRWGPPTFKYRGWFINDEDLLGRFAPAPLNDGVFSLEAWDRIFETLLRLRANTVIPGTFTFPDERMQILAARRGLVNSQHHICVVGLNTFQWPKELPYSYRTHPGTLEAAWQTCVDSLKDRECVWTVGFRGKHDRAFWADDKEIKTPEERGKIITDAIARQVEMVHRVQPGADCIANLWMEAVELYKAGHLKLPPGVMLVWPDDGAGMIRDQGEVHAGQGIYYHTAMLSGSQSQLTEIVPPARIHQEMMRFVKAGATGYFVVNTSDVRPVPLTTNYCMRLAWDAAGELNKSSEAAQRDYLADWCRQQYGPAAAGQLAPLYGEYFATPYMQAEMGENKVLSEIKRLVAKVRAATSPRKMPVKLAQQMAADFAPSARHLDGLAPKVQAALEHVPADRRDFFTGHLLLQVEVHRNLTAALESLCAAVEALGHDHRDEAVARLDEALADYDQLVQTLRRGEYGRWKGWYAGERFTEVFDNQVRLAALQANLKGQPEPVVRANGRYPELYGYQVQARDNYPLFYPAARRPPTPREMVAAVAGAVVRDMDNPLPFDWGEGVLLTGLMRAHRLTGQDSYLNFVRDFADHWQRQGIGKLLAERGYCGHWGPGQALLELYETTHDQRYLRMAQEIAAFIAAKAERTRDGGLSHFFGKPQLWDDTLAMVCPVLAPLGRIQGRSEPAAEAARQLGLFGSHLRDPQAGLYYHMWDESTGEHSPCFWGRGNGWVALSYIEVLRNMDAAAPARPALAEAFVRLMAAVVRRQDGPSGLWRTLLDNPASYTETSASAMFLYALIEGRRLGLLDRSYDEPIERGWAGLSTQINNLGQVIGVSGGTGPGDAASYLARPRGTYTWGTGAALMAACAYAETHGQPSGNGK